MNIALIVDSYKSWTGGPSVILRETKKSLQKKKIKISIITSDLLNEKKLLFKSKLNKFDICHLYGGWTLFHIKTFLTAFLLKKKIIIHPLGFYEPWSLGQKKIKKTIAWNAYQFRILSNADLIHCASKTEEKNILKISKSFNTKVLPYGISNEAIKKVISKKKVKKKAVFFSRIHKKKGIGNLISAWKKIDNPEWHLDIYGPTEDKKYLNDLMLSVNKNNKITFHKPIFNTKKKYRTLEKYDFMILPTYSENFGYIVLESLARGVPVLTTKNTPWLEIKKKNSGWISDNSVDSMTRSLKKIFYLSKKNNNYFYSKSKNAIKHAQNYNWNSLSNSYIEVYKKILNE